MSPDSSASFYPACRTVLWQMDAASGLTWAEDLRQAKTK